MLFRSVIFHADDIGNFQSSLAAYRELLDVGLLSSAATMVPCSWFPATAEFCRANAGHPHLDMGIHLTLTSEYRVADPMGGPPRPSSQPPGEWQRRHHSPIPGTSLLATSRANACSWLAQARWVKVWP